MGNITVYVDSDGYLRIEDHHKGETHTAFSHRLVAVAEHGVNSVTKKHVHHKNTHKTDNRPENLEIMTPGEHIRYHSKQRTEEQPWHKESVLRSMYEDARMSQKEIANSFDITEAVVRKWINRYDIETRNTEEQLFPDRDFSYREKDVLEDMYHNDKMSQKEIAETFDVSQTTIHKWLKKHGIKARNRGTQT